MDSALGTVTRWLVILGLMIAYWPFGGSARADEVYSARFSWKGAVYRFVLTTSEGATAGAGGSYRSRFGAAVFKDGVPQASCERLSPEEAPLDVNTMGFHCQGAMFGPLKRLVSFQFPRRLDGAPKLAITDGAGNGAHVSEVSMLASD